VKIGIVCYWFNRGQATIGRHIRSICDDLGYETFVLARPTKSKFVLPNHTATDQVWDQPRVQRASHSDIPLGEYLAWAKVNGLDAIFFDQNYQFDEIAAIRNSGVATIGRFVWEAFSRDHVGPARSAFDVIYSLTKCEQKRYADFGIDSPYLNWGIHPETAPFPETAKRAAITFLFPGGFISTRKPLGAVIEAFAKARSPDIRLIIKTQTPLKNSHLAIPPARKARADFDERDPELRKRATLLSDPRMLLITDDRELDGYYELISSCHVLLAPSRWEGLGLHLYEAIALGLPVITNDNPPMNELVTHGENGLLVPSRPLGPTPSGIEAYEPSVEGLTEAIDRLSERGALEALTSSARLFRKRMPWQRTIDGYRELLAEVSAHKGLRV
jgi:glycosyltransferase involved in cell wall biosynthesis